MQTTLRALGAARDLVYNFALAWMPLGFAVWLAGMHLRSYLIAAAGFLLGGPVGAVAGAISAGGHALVISAVANSD